MKILLLGYGISNKAVYKYFFGNDIEIVCDDEKDKIRKIRKELPLFDICFCSPSIRYKSSLYLLAKALAKKMTNEVDYALNLIGYKNTVCVTGSDGKTSLVKLLQHILSNYGTCAIGGNIGITLIDDIEKYKKADYIVVELSSYQIELLSSEIEIGIIKNIHENHLDTYLDKTIYYANKIRLINYSKKLILGNSVTFQKNNKKNLKYNFYVKNNFIYEDDMRLLSIKKLKYRDKSFIENVILTLKVLKYYHLEYSHIETLLNSFNRVKYRLEEIGKYKEVVFINDGKSSTALSSAYAYKNYRGKKVLILGGIHKSGKFNFKVEKNDEVLIYGMHRKKIKKELKKGKLFNTLNEVLNAIKLDEKKTIIFSPGCSSFDQYNNYIERSEEFEKWVYTWIK